MSKLSNRLLRWVPPVAVTLTLLFVLGSIGGYYYPRWTQVQQMRYQFDLWMDCHYGNTFKMRATAEPEISSWYSYPDFDTYPTEYKRVEYVLDYPPEEEREYGVIYFMPMFDYTEKHVLNMNCIISLRPELLADTGLVFPLTVQDVVYRSEAVDGIIHNMEDYELSYFFDEEDPEYYPSPDGWYDDVKRVRASLAPPVEAAESEGVSPEAA